MKIFLKDSTVENIAVSLRHIWLEAWQPLGSVNVSYL
jgi:hypothetical protein